MKVRAMRRELTGVVISDKMKDTIVVNVERFAMHALYKKRIRKFKKYKVHDESNKAKAGDRVRIMQTRPISKEKSWRLVEVLK